MKYRFIFFVLLLTIFGLGAYLSAPEKSSSVKVGILHSLSGTMKISEKDVADVTIAAFKEMNEKGGILGHTIEPVVVDGKSDPEHFESEAEKLITEKKVNAIFGCWNSSSRKKLKPIVEKHNHLLFYPVQYEGFESSPNIIYLGQTPNQQIRPAIKFAMDHFGKTFFLVGSDYIFPRAANLYIKDFSSVLKNSIIGEAYVPMGGTDFKTIVQEIQTKKPNVIFNTLNGDSNIAFFRELHRQGIDAQRIPVISFSISDAEVKQMGKFLPPEALIGHYASWSYFGSIKSPENEAFKQFLKRYAIHATPTDAMEAAYNGVQIYKQAVEECQSFEPDILRRCLPMQSFKGAGGIIYIDNKNNHSWKSSRIGRVNRNLEFEIILDTSTPTKAEPYPSYRSVQEWDEKMKDYHLSSSENNR
jgi:urea transport system substrate-binding protein